MDKKEYLTRVFEGQISSLERQLNVLKQEIKDTEKALNELYTDAKDVTETLEIAKSEMNKANPMYWEDNYESKN